MVAYILFIFIDKINGSSDNFMLKGYLNKKMAKILV